MLLFENGAGQGGRGANAYGTRQVSTIYAPDSQYQVIMGVEPKYQPIMMTTMAALMGTLPIALGLGAGADTRRPLGLAVVGGLVFSQFLTLYLTPVFYTYMESWQTKLKKRNWRKQPI